MKSVKVDKIFLTSLITILLFGLFVFLSASLGLLARDGATFSSVVFNHLFFGLFGGSIALFVFSKINYKIWKKYALWIYVGALILTTLVFVPHIGFKHGGAYRWILLGPVSFQPSEFLKFGFLVALAAWLSSAKDKVATFKYGTLPFLILAGVTAAVMLAQPDTDTYMVMFFAGVAMLLCAGGKIRDIAILALISVLAIGVLAFARPYVMQRITTFINPASDPLGAGYQIQQSLIAIGSGGLTGRGFGQSIQKFNYLPEPIGDSIFAVLCEEFGLIGGVALIFLICFFAVRGLKIATKVPDTFGGLLTIGIVILIISQSFINIGAMLGVLPLSGIPLIFVSHGGTALLAALAEVGIVLNISKTQRIAVANND